MAFSAVGSLGSNTEKNNDTSLTMTVSATAEAGNLVAVFAVMDNFGTTGQTSQLSVADSSGGSNTYTKLAEITQGAAGNGDGVVVGVWVCKLSSQLTSGSGTITLTSTDSLTAKAMAAYEFTMGATTTIGFGGVQGTDYQVSGQASGSDPPAISLSGLTSRQYLLFHVIGEEGGASHTPDGDYTEIFDTVETTGQSTASNVSLFAAYRIATLTGDTADADSAGDRELAQILAAIYEAAAATHKDLTAGTTTDAAQTLDFDKTIFKTLTVAATTDAAQTLTLGGAQDITIVAATTTDAAQALSVTKTIFKTLAAAAEADAAQAVTYAQAGDFFITNASEADAAQAADADKHVTISPTATTDTAGPIVPWTVIYAAETDAAQTLTFFISGAKDITAAATTDAANTIAASKHASAASAAETDTAQAQTLEKHATVGAAAEGDASQQLDADKHADLTAAAETNAAQTLTYSQAGAYTITPAVSTNTAQTLSITHVHYRTATPAATTDQAQALSTVGLRSITHASSTDAAPALTFYKAATLVVAATIDTAQTLPAFKSAAISATSTTDAAAALGGIPVTFTFDQPTPSGGADEGTPGGAHYDQPTPTPVRV